MSSDTTRPTTSEPTGSREPSPVDEARAVREALSARFAGDVDRIADHAANVAAAWRDRLASRPIPSASHELPPPPEG